MSHTDESSADADARTCVAVTVAVPLAKLYVTVVELVVPVARYVSSPCSATANAYV
jgi:hypothetical protein